MLFAQAVANDFSTNAERNPRARWLALLVPDTTRPSFAEEGSRSTLSFTYEL